MLDFIFMGPFDLPDHIESEKMQNEKNLTHSGTRTHSPEIWSLMLYNLRLPGLHVSYIIKKKPLCICDVPRLPSYGIYISQLVRFARCCTSVLDFHSKNLQITSKLLTQGYRYHKLRKTFGKFFRSYSQLLSKFGDISFQEYVSKGISHPVFYGDLVYKLRRVKGTPNFISSGSKIVKRLRRRQYDPLIIERTIGLVLGPSTTLYGPFLKHCTLTNKAVGTIWRALSKPPQRRQGPDLRPLWLLVRTPSAIRPELAFSRAEHSLPYSDVTIYIFAIFYLSSMLYVYRFLWPLRLGWLLVCCLYKEVYLQIFKRVSFWLHGCCGEWEGWARKPVNHTSWVAVVTPTDRPKSVRNRCVIELFCDVVYVVILPFWQFCWCRGFCHRTESDLFLFLFLYQCLHRYEFENDEVERNSSGICSVLCYMYKYWISLYCANSKETHKSCVCFQHAKLDQAFYLIVCLYVESKHRTCAPLCYLYNKATLNIPICNTK